MGRNGLGACGHGCGAAWIQLDGRCGEGGLGTAVDHRPASGRCGCGIARLDVDCCVGLETEICAPDADGLTGLNDGVSIAAMREHALAAAQHAVQASTGHIEPIGCLSPQPHGFKPFGVVEHNHVVIARPKHPHVVQTVVVSVRFWKVDSVVHGAENVGSR